MPSTVRTVPEASEPRPLAEKVTVAMRWSLMVIEPEPLTAAVVELDVDEATEMLPLVSQRRNLYPLGMVPVESE